MAILSSHVLTDRSGRPLLLSARAIGRPERMTESRTSQERTRNRSARGDERGEDGRHDRVEARSATASRSAAGVPIRKDRLMAVLRPREEYWFFGLDPPETDEYRHTTVGGFFGDRLVGRTGRGEEVALDVSGRVAISEIGPRIGESEAATSMCRPPRVRVGGQNRRVLM